ncbi:hypothetical protein ACFQEX_26900 [Roseibium salinum]|uniref:hypothetical protein n=1 Tax=Roseibium salinum TaxID=1604349 RepID=UPI00360B0A4A
MAKVAVNEPASAVCRKLLAERQQALLMPFDNRRQGVDDQHRAHIRRLECSGRRVAEPEPADDDAKIRFGQCLQRNAPESYLRDGKLGRHQEFVVELDLVDVFAGAEVTAAAEHKRAQFRDLIIEFCKQGGQAIVFLSEGGETRNHAAGDRHRRGSVGQASPTSSRKASDGFSTLNKSHASASRTMGMHRFGSGAGVTPPHGSSSRNVQLSDPAPRNGS